VRVGSGFRLASPNHAKVANTRLPPVALLDQLKAVVVRQVSERTRVMAAMDCGQVLARAMHKQGRSKRGDVGFTAHQQAFMSDCETTVMPGL